MFFRKDFGFDLGTSYMHICQKDKGVVLNEPEVIAIDRRTKKAIAVGAEAYDMYEKTPHSIHINMPVKNGVIADFENVANLLNIQCNNLKINKSRNTYAIVSVPYNISEVERRAVYDIFARSKVKFKKVFMLEKPLAAGIGCGIDVLQPAGSFIVDIGGGTTEISVISLGGVVISQLLKVGGLKFDTNIKNFVKRKYNVYIGLKTAEKIKKNISTVMTEDDSDCVEVTGRDVVTGLPKDISVSGEDVYLAIKEDINTIIDAIKYILEKTPPELSSDILESGIYLTGGSANIRNLSKLISNETNLKVNVCESPCNSVINGVCHILKNYNKHKNILYRPKD